MTLLDTVFAQEVKRKPMAISKRPIYRSKALQAYAQQRQKTVLPRFVAPPVFLLCWILLALLASATIVAWLAKVPSYMSASGVVLAGQSGNAEAVAVIFVPAGSATTVHAGQAIQIQIGTTGPQLSSIVAAVDPALISPQAARQQYGLSDATAQTITQPSYVVTIPLGPHIPVQTYAGSLVHAQIQVGTRSVLSLLPVLNQFIGG